jgi:ABC-type dipeptide/oligopeptide/nickel transport system permease subunit
MAVAEATPRELAIPVRKERSPWADAFQQLLQNKMAVASGVFIIILLFVALFTDNALIAVPLGQEVTPLLAKESFDHVHFKLNNAPPSREYPLGNDYLGRDILSRTLYGARVSLSVAFVAATVSLVIGLVYGLASGYFGGRVDDIMMRIVDFLYAFPILIFVILLQVYFKAVSRRGGTGLVGAMIGLNEAMGGMFFLFVALGALNWLQMARIARGQVLSYKEKEFVEAARMIGAGDMRIIFRHLLPNILGPCIVAETLTIPIYIFWEAFLSFLGLGVEPPTPSWGIMISEAYQGLRSYPYQLVGPSVALVLTTLTFNFLGDGLRDAFDPRLRGTM